MAKKSAKKKIDRKGTVTIKKKRSRKVTKTKNDDPTPKSRNPETKLFSLCMRHCKGYLLSHLAYGYPAKTVVNKACNTYAPYFSTVGLYLSGTDKDYDARRAYRFVRYLQKQCYNWTRTDRRKKDGRSKEMQLYLTRKELRNIEVGLWVHNPEARQLEIQDIIERNRGRNDSAVIRALVQAQQEIVQGTAVRVEEDFIECERVIVDRESAVEGKDFIIHKNDEDGTDG